MKFSIETIIELENKGDAERYYLCLRPEIPDIKKGDAEIKLEGKKIILSIRADEITTIKALINSQIKLIEAVKKTEKVVE